MSSPSRKEKLRPIAGSTLCESGSVELDKLLDASRGRGAFDTDASSSDARAIWEAATTLCRTQEDGVIDSTEQRYTLCSPVM
jgi:hypothetical protein